MLIQLTSGKKADSGEDLPRWRQHGEHGSGSVLENLHMEIVEEGVECSPPEVGEGVVCSTQVEEWGQKSICSPLNMSGVEEGVPLSQECMDGH